MLEEHLFLSVYYESRKRELKRRLVNEGRCDERLKGKVEESTCRTHTGLFCVFIITDKAKLVGEEVKGVGVMKDEELNGRVKVWFRKKPIDLCPSESEGDEDGVGTGVKFYSVFRYTIVNRSRICCRKVKGFVVYYESLIRELKTKTIHGFRCDESLKLKFVYYELVK